MALQIAIEILMRAQGKQKNFLFIEFIGQKKQSVPDLEFVNGNACQIPLFHLADLGRFADAPDLFYESQQTLSFPLFFPWYMN